VPRCDRSRWENWAGDVVVDRPGRHCYPTSLDELVSILAEADGLHPHPQVRACGGRWSLSDVAATPDWIVETQEMRATRYDVVPDALTDHVRDELSRRTGPWRRSSLYHVEAGITIGDLNLRLDRRAPEADAAWGAMPADRLGGPVADPGRRWALPTMPGGSGQTVAGAISTATHGGEHRIAPLADLVRAIHLVSTGGTQLWIERDEPLTDRARLQRALPDVVPIYCSHLFDAVLVSVGRMGVLYAVVLEVVEQFTLEQRTAVSTWAREERRCPPSRDRPDRATPRHGLRVPPPSRPSSRRS
jgi:hypothetical protein